MAADLGLGDIRVEFIADYVLQTYKYKADKFAKMYSLDENKQMFIDFLDKPDNLYLLVFPNSSGVLNVSFDWPGMLKNKACFFVKKSKDAISKDPTLFRKSLGYGDLASSPVEQFSGFIQDVCINFTLFLDYTRNQKGWTPWVLRFLLCYRVRPRARFLRYFHTKILKNARKSRARV